MPVPKPGRPRGKHTLRNIKIAVHVTPEEHAAIAARADMMGLTISDLIRLGLALEIRTE